MFLSIFELFYSYCLGIGSIVHLQKQTLIIHRCLNNAYFCSSFCPCRLSRLSPGPGLVHGLRGRLRHQRGGTRHYQLQALTLADENR